MSTIRPTINILWIILSAKKIFIKIIIFPLIIGAILGAILGFSAKSQDGLNSTFGYQIPEQFGEVVIRAKGVIGGISTEAIQQKTVFFTVVTLLIVCSLWNLVKSYGALNNYLRKSGVLLPLTVALSVKRLKRVLWLTSWISTLILISSTVLTVYLLNSTILENIQVYDFLLRMGEVKCILWLIALTSGSLAVILLSSLGHSIYANKWYGEIFTHVMPVLTAISALVWILSYAIDIPYIVNLRTLISLVPIGGFVPIILAPAFNVEITVLVLHTLLSSLFIHYLLTTSEVQIRKRILELE